MGELFCSQPVGPPDAADGAPDEAAAASPKETASGRPKYCGLLVCRRAGAAASPAAGGMAAQGMCGASPLLTNINVVRQFGTLQHPNNHGRVDRPGWLGLVDPLLVCCCCWRGSFCSPGRTVNTVLFFAVQGPRWCVDGTLQLCGAWLHPALCCWPDVALHLLVTSTLACTEQAQRCCTNPTGAPQKWSCWG